MKTNDGDMQFTIIKKLQFKYLNWPSIIILRSAHRKIFRYPDRQFCQWATGNVEFRKNSGGFKIALSSLDDCDLSLTACDNIYRFRDICTALLRHLDETWYLRV